MDRYQLSEFILSISKQATSLAPMEFHDRLLRDVQTLFSFDKAWYGWSFLRRGKTMLIQTKTHALPPDFEKSILPYLDRDPFVRLGRQRKFFAQSMTFKNTQFDPPVQQLAASLGAADILSGHCQVPDGPFNFFMSLFRGPDKTPFTATETKDMRVVLRHLEQALSSSLILDLSQTLDKVVNWALVSKDGEIFLSSTHFKSHLEAHRSRGLERRHQLQEIIARDFISAGGFLFSCEQYAPALMLVTVQKSSPWAQLSPGEKRVAAKLIKGATMRAIAQSSGVSLNTIRNQTASIYRKTGVKTRVELVRLSAQST